MNKRNKVIIAGATTLVAAGLMLAIVANGVGNFLGTYAEGTIYTLTLNSSNGGSGFASSYSSSEQTNTAARTTQGNEIDFNYKNAKQSSGNYVDLAAGGYFYNTTKLTGLESVRVIYSGEENALDIATSSTESFSDGATLATDTQYDIDVNMDYFRIRNISGSAVQISSVIVKYACATRVAYYTKVASTADVIDGQYLIVYEDGNLAFDGSLSTLDATNNTTSVTIVNDGSSKKIQASTSIDSASFTISAKSGGEYSIKSSSGYYIGNTATKTNKIDTSTSDIYSNEITVSNGVATITAEGGKILGYNTDTSQNRFRFMTSGSVALYKRSGSSSGGGDTPTPTPTPETTYELVTNGLSAGDEVVVVAQTSRTATSGYALNSAIYSTYYLTAVNATMSDQKLTYTDDMTLWTVGGTTGAYTLYAQDASKYLYGYVNGTHLNVSVQSSAGEGSSWNITENSNADGYDVVTTYDSTNVYLEFMLYKSTTPEFTGYSASSTTYPLNFYRKTTSSVDPVAVEGVSLNKSSLSLVQDASETLIATVTPSNATDKSVTWTSSDPGVATVDSTGKVTALAAGSTTITVKTTDGEFAATCTVSVTAKVAVTGVSVSPTSSTLNKGETVTLTATVSPSTATNKNVTWSSNNTAIATVDSEGKVTGIAAGTATITVTTADGGKTATSTITVNPTPVSGVSLDQSAISLKVGASQTLVATVTPEDADNKDVTWSCSPTSVATVDENGTVTAVAEGNATVTATSKDDSTKSAQCAVSVVQSSEPVVGSEFELVTDASELNTGDYIVLGCSAQGKTAGLFYSKYLQSVDSTFTNNKVTLQDSNSLIELGGSAATGWTLKSQEGYLKTGSNALYVNGSESDTWDITISSSSAQICPSGSSSYIMYNSNAPRFAVYSGSQVDIEIYKQSGKVNSVSLDASDIGVNVGQTHTLTATISPASALNKNVSWSSSDETVASVTTEGVVTGVKAGTATITVTTEDGNKTASCLVRVQSGSTIVPASIELNKTSAEIEINGSVQLEANIKPENAANKNVTWSSSDTSVATLDSTGKVTGVAVSTSPVTITAKTSNNLTATCSVTVSAEKIAKWTIMIYMCGADLESGSEYDSSTGETTYNYDSSQASGYASSDIDEIIGTTDQPDDVNIIMQTGGATAWQSGHSYTISASVNERWHVRDNQLVKDESLTDLNMGLASTFQSFVQWGLTEYKAEKTGIILWNHGGGMRGVCYDEKHNDDTLINSETNSAFASAFSATNRTENLEWIGYDACLMAVQDIAEFNSHYFNYMVSSEESELGYGWDYDVWLEKLYSDQSSTTIFKSIVDSFIASVGGASASTYQGYTADQTLSYLNLSYMDEYLTAFESLASSLLSTIDSKSNFKSFMTSNVKYFAGTDYDYFHTFDAMDFLNELAKNSTYSSLSAEITAAKNALSNVIEYSVAQKGAGQAYGLCLVYVNNSDYSLGSKFYSTAQTNFTNWRTLNLNSNYGYL